MRRLLLDFGGVVIKTPFENLDRVGSPEWFGPWDPARDPLWTALQNGEISERDHWHQRASELFGDHEDPVRALMDPIFAPPAIDVVRPETMDLVDFAGGAAVLTNDLSRFHDDGWLAEMGLADTFDPLIDLSYTGHLKPSAAAYAHAVAALDIPPGEIVFVDDQAANVEGAIESGVCGVWFDVTDPAGSVDRAKAQLT